MKFKVLFILVLLLSFSQSELFMQQKKKTAKASPLQGNWTTLPNPMEASALRLEFKPNKKFSYILSSNWYGTYKLEGTKLISSMYLPIYKKYKNDTTTVLIYSDTLIQIGKDRGVETTTKMFRKNKGSAGLIGEWSIADPNVQTSNITYDSTGKFSLEKILNSYHGEYTTLKDTLIAFSNGQPILRCRYVIDRGLLRLYSPKQSGPITLEKSDK